MKITMPQAGSSSPKSELWGPDQGAEVAKKMINLDQFGMYAHPSWDTFFGPSPLIFSRKHLLRIFYLLLVIWTVHFSCFSSIQCVRTAETS